MCPSEVLVEYVADHTKKLGDLEHMRELKLDQQSLKQILYLLKVVHVRHVLYFLEDQFEGFTLVLRL